jgi:hypothetical protein
MLHAAVVAVGVARGLGEAIGGDQAEVQPPFSAGR